MSAGIISFGFFLLPILFFANVGGFNTKRSDVFASAKLAPLNHGGDIAASAKLAPLNNEGGIAASAKLAPLNNEGGIAAKLGPLNNEGSLEPGHLTSKTNLAPVDVEEKNYNGFDMSLGPRFFNTFTYQVITYPKKWLGFNWTLAACHYSKWMSLILHVQPPAEYDGQYFVKVKMIFYIRNRNATGQLTISDTLSHTYEKNEDEYTGYPQTGWGIDEMAKIEDLIDPENGFLDKNDGTMVVGVRFKVVSITMGDRVLDLDQLLLDEKEENM